MLRGNSKAVEVERPIPVEYDLGNLAAFDHNVLDFEALAWVSRSTRRGPADPRSGSARKHTSKTTPAMSYSSS